MPALLPQPAFLGGFLLGLILLVAGPGKVDDSSASTSAESVSQEAHGLSAGGAAIVLAAADLLSVPTPEEPGDFRRDTRCRSSHVSVEAVRAFASQATAVSRRPRRLVLRI